MYVFDTGVRMCFIKNDVKIFMIFVKFSIDIVFFMWYNKRVKEISFLKIECKMICDARGMRLCCPDRVYANV